MLDVRATTFLPSLTLTLCPHALSLIRAPSYADNASLLDTASGKKNGSSFTENFVGYCLASYCCLCGVLGCQLRGDIRKQYGLKGDDCNGFLLHCCLSRCALCQENRELKQRNVASSVGTPVDEAPAQVQMGTN